MSLEQIFEQLWQDYTTQNPSAYSIYTLFSERGEKVQNDHIAFRTFNDMRMGIKVLAEPFLERGYKPVGQYQFIQKNLSAMHFELPGKKDAPRVFISELMLEKFSPYLQDRVRTAIDRADPGVWGSKDLIFAGNPFGTPSFETYQMLRAESEYAAWLYVHGFRVNHFTVSVNSLKGFRGIEDVNDFLKENGFLMNSSGGEIKGSKEQLLKQSSTLAEIVPAEFIEGVREVPACYYEFAERFRDADGKLFSGFITGSADKIFESTDFYEK
jgi:hypothetical protein